MLEKRQSKRVKQMTRNILFALMMITFGAAKAQISQQKIGDFDLSYNANRLPSRAPRPLNYYPEGRSFVCVNGENRYTRALYGGTDAFRIETSDRPVFATFEKGTVKNIALLLTYRGETIALDSTDFCESRYEGGRRDYLLRDNRWQNGELRLSVLALTKSKGAIWRVSASGFSESPFLTFVMRDAADQKPQRNGDIGKFQRPGAFEARNGGERLFERGERREERGERREERGERIHQEGEERRENSIERIPQQGREPNVQRSTFNVQRYNHQAKSELYFLLDDYNITSGDYSERFNLLEQERQTLANSVTFTTPDPYINTLGSALVMAADGAWDGETWLHGAVGWRSQLPGWRAGYLADFLGMPDRAASHFEAYAKSQVTDVPQTIKHPTQDPEHNLSRGIYKWGTPMYSNGYICRTPNNNHKFHHYDMNLNYIDELLWHFQFSADSLSLRRFWPLIKLHLDWEKRNWDPDNDHLFDAYCCIWASDALYYNAGAATHSSAYNYRAFNLAARIADLLGEDSEPYRKEADAILQAMNSRLWVEDEGHWAEYQDYMGLRRVHKNAALWSIYTPIDCESCSPEQAFRAMKWVDKNIPHITFPADTKGGETHYTLSTSSWQPYEWSINNVAMAEVMHTALAYFLAGRPEEGFRLTKNNVLDFMYMGSSPANFGQISYYDAVLGESYRDFSDVTGISARTLLQGLFGIQPNALYGECIIRPGMPQQWDSASVHTPYIDYEFRRQNGYDVYDITQHFAQPLQIVFRQNLGNGKYKEVKGTSETHQTIRIKTANPFDEERPCLSDAAETIAQNMADSVPLTEKLSSEGYKTVPLNDFFNAKVDDIFKNEYLSPRPPYTSLEIPKQGIGDWCSTKKTADIRCSEPIVYTSLWDNYPDSVTIPLKGRAEKLRLTMAGSTNHMQCYIANGIIRVTYRDGSSDSLLLINPDNWCPIEQDFYDDGFAFRLKKPRPLRQQFTSGIVSRRLSDALGIEGAVRIIPGGASTILEMPLNKRKKLQKITIRTLSNDVVIGLMKLEIAQ